MHEALGHIGRTLLVQEETHVGESVDEDLVFLGYSHTQYLDRSIVEVVGQ